MPIEAAQLLAIVTADTFQAEAGLAKVGAAFDRTSAQAHGLSGAGGAMGLLTKGFGLLGIATAAYSVKEAVQYNASMTKVAAYTNLTKQEVDSASKSLLGMSVALGTKPNELAKGFYLAASSGLNLQQALDVTKISAQAAAGGLGSAEKVTFALGSAVNAYAKSGLTARQASDYFVAGVKDAHAPTEALSTALAKIVGVSASLGVSLPEVVANLTSMTRVGFSADQAATSIQSVETSLVRMLNPSKQVASALKMLGTNGHDVNVELKDKGMAATLTDLAQRNSVYAASHGGMNDAIVKLFPNVRALRDVLGTAGAQGAKYGEALDRIKHATDGNGATAAAFAVTQKSVAFQIKQVESAVTVLAIKIGNVLLPIISSAIDWAMKHKTVMKDVAFAIGVVMVGAVAALTVALLTNPFVLITVGVIGLIAAFKAWYDSSRTVQAVVSEMFAILLVGFRTFSNAFLDGLSSIIGAAGDFAGAMGFKGMAANLHGAARDIEGFRHSLNDTLDAAKNEALLKSAALAVNMKQPLEAQLGDYTRVANQYHTTIDKVLDAAGISGADKAAILARNVATGIMSGEPGVGKAAMALAHSADAAIAADAGNAFTAGSMIGLNIAAGMMAGIASNSGPVLRSAAEFGHAAANAAKLGAKVSSPSQITVYAGQMIAHGLVVGMSSKAAEVAAAAQALGLSTADYIRIQAEQAAGSADAATSGAHHRRGGGPGSRGGHPYVRHPRVSHGGASHSGRTAGAATVHRDVYGVYATADAQYAASVARHNESIAKSHEAAALKAQRAHEAALKAILRQSQVTAQQMIADQVETAKAAEKSATEQIKTISAAVKQGQVDLQAMRKEAEAFSDTLQKGIQSGTGNIVQMFDGTKKVAGESIQALTQTMRDQLLATQKFGSDLTSLAGMGLGKDLVAQIAAAGVQSGGALADSLVQAGPDAVKGVATLMTQISEAGKTAADAITAQYYQAGIDQMQGQINGMRSQEAALQAEVLRVQAILAQLAAAKEGVAQATNLSSLNSSLLAAGIVPPPSPAAATVVNVHVDGHTILPAVVHGTTTVLRTVARTQKTGKR